jgi:hypothetical protein
MASGRIGRLKWSASPVCEAKCSKKTIHVHIWQQNWRI